MKLSPHLAFNGQCREAFEFYEKCLGGKITMMMPYGDSPAAQQVPPEWSGKILHATLAIGESILYGGDAYPGQYQAPRGFNVIVGPDDPVEAENIFKGLSENGTIVMPLQKTFWSSRFGMVVDRFGTPWKVNCQQASG